MLGMIGPTLFAGQFLLLFFAFEAGLPPGLASITQQMQVFFTVLLSATFLGDVPTRRQAAGMSLAGAISRRRATATGRIALPRRGDQAILFCTGEA
jgi:drug/metabolite transporter (DMT)-like permease